ncbi:hypothetical protein KEM48_003811, partial [Puccinia striiformis f. sp. tritici PST-130]
MCDVVSPASCGEGGQRGPIGIVTDSTRSQPKWLDPLNLTIPYPRDPLPELKPPSSFPSIHPNHHTCQNSPQLHPAQHRQSLITSNGFRSHGNTSDAEQGSTPLKSNQVKERRPARQSSVFSTKRRQVSSATGPTRSQKRKRTELDTAENSLEPNSNLDSESDPDVAVMDITQDSDCDNTKMKPGAKKLEDRQSQSSMMLNCILNLRYLPKVIKTVRSCFISVNGVLSPTKRVQVVGPTCGYIVMGGWDDPLALV